MMPSAFAFDSAATSFSVGNGRNQRSRTRPTFFPLARSPRIATLIGSEIVPLPTRITIRELRAKGKKVGLVRLRWFRPFPTEKLVAALKKAKALGIIDRDYSFGSPFGSGV